MLFFQPFNQFSLVNMPSAGNDLFRTFYTLWVAVIILYSINTMRLYLRAHLKYHLFRNQTL